MDWFSNDKLFVEELRAGYAWQELPATYFRCLGFDVCMPELTLRGDISMAGQWTERDTDLLVNGHSIEVKSRRERFTSPDDFPYDQPFVDTVSGYDSKLVRPVAYVFVSRVTGSMLCVSSSTPSRFQVVERRDSVREIREHFYVCSRSQLRTMDRLAKYLLDRRC